MCPVRQGQVIYELSGLSESTSLKALNRASNKLPIKTKIVKLFF
jgi:ribosomal protein L16/L10AE